ncbi:Hypothetical predicted protein [Mytilus galloprovincialis]|uniref:Uncharacterized protein n=1 Tax=Mytilus galloprovincialis TaxID=29158 RepID=A0A8B6CJR1_MYTGA|nr:Hypothetical predicted protein [Mytilus galloprovincialis]
MTKRYTFTLKKLVDLLFLSYPSDYSSYRDLVSNTLKIAIGYPYENEMPCSNKRIDYILPKNRKEREGDEDLLDMRFSRRWLYKNVFISADNTIISNVQTIDTSSSAEAQLQNYRGTISDLCVGKNELIYYEVYYTYTIVKALTTTSLVLEVGLADRLKVDRYYYVGSNNVSGWSFHVARNADDNSIYVYTEDPVHLKLLGPFSTNTVGKKVHGKFKLSINRRRNEFSLRQNDSIFHVFKNVTSGGKLCPVFGVYNSNQIHVKLQLMNPRNFTNFPW